MAKTKRKDGYYWVRYGRFWEPALWENPYWEILGLMEKVIDGAFHEIGPRIPDYKPKKK